MATPTTLTSGQADSLSTFPTASVTPTANTPVLVAVGATSGSAIPEPTLSGCNGTWTKVEDAEGGGTRTVWLFRSVIASPTTDTIDIAFGTTVGNCMWSVVEWSGKATGNNGADALPRPLQRDLTTADTTHFIKVQDVFDPANDYLYVSFAGQVSAITPGTGWTELHEIQGNIATLSTAWSDGSPTNNEARATWSSSGHHMMIVVEVVEAGATPPVLGPVTKLTESFTNIGSGNFESATINPSADCLLVVRTWFQRDGATPQTPVVSDNFSGGSLIWTLITSVDYGTIATPDGRLHLFVAKTGATPGSGKVTLDYAGGVGSVVGGSVYEVPGIDTSQTAANLVVQSDTNAADSGTSLAATLAAFGNVNNGTIVFVDDVSGTYPEVGDGLEYAQGVAGRDYLGWRHSNDLTPSFDEFTSGETGLIAFEIKAAAAAGATFPDAPLNVTAVAQSDTEILVSWDAVSGADAYDVERDSVVVANKVAGLSFSDTGLSPSTQYSYRVRAARTP